jgi:hypothetical protein
MYDFMGIKIGQSYNGSWKKTDCEDERLMEVAWGCVQREALVLMGDVPYIIQTFTFIK